MRASWLAGPEDCLVAHARFGSGDHSSAHDIHDEQGKRQTEAHSDSEQNGAGWIGRPRLNADCHGIDCIVEDGSPDIAAKRLYGIETQRSRGERCDCLSCGRGLAMRLMECRGGNGCGGQDERYNGGGLVRERPKRIVLAVCRQQELERDGGGGESDKHDLGFLGAGCPVAVLEDKAHFSGCNKSHEIGNGAHELAPQNGTGRFVYRGCDVAVDSKCCEYEERYDKRDPFAADLPSCQHNNWHE